MKKIFSFVVAALTAMTMSAEAISVAEALQIASQLEEGKTTEEEYEIVGYVTAMQGSEDGGWAQYGNQIFWIADEQGTAASNADGALEIYQGVASEQVYVTDKVSVKGKLTNYQGLLETAKRAPVTILEKNAERPEIDEPDVVFTGEDFLGQGTEQTGSEVSATKDGVTFTCDKAYSDDAHTTLRCYKNGVITITSETEQIGKLVFKFYGTYTGDLATEVVVNAKEWEYTLPNQARIEKLSIFFGEYEPIEPAEIEEITVAKAMEIGEALADNAYTPVEYAVVGFAVSVKEYDTQYNNQTFYMSDDETAEHGDFTAYRAKPETPVEAGQKVRVIGKIQKYVGDYGTTIEITGGKVEFVGEEGIENIELTKDVKKVMVDGVMYIVRDNKMFNVQGAQVR